MNNSVPVSFWVWFSKRRRLAPADRCRDLNDKPKEVLYTSSLPYPTFPDPLPQNKPKVRISDENDVVLISDRQSETLDQLCAHYPLPTDNPDLWRHWVNFEIQEYDARSKTCVGSCHEHVLKVMRTSSGQITTSITPRDGTSKRQYFYAEHHFRKRLVNYYKSNQRSQKKSLKDQRVDYMIKTDNLTTALMTA